MELVILPILIFAVPAIWLSIVATISLQSDDSLVPFQFYAQLLIAWIVPIFGASFITHLVYEHSPEAVPLRLIPWPFKTWIAGKDPKPNRNRDERETDYYTINIRHSRNTDDGHDE